MPDGSSALRTLIRQLGQREFGSSGWSATFRQMLRLMLDPEMDFPSVDYDAAVGMTANFLEQNEDLVRPILVEAGFPLGDVDEGAYQTEWDALMSALDAALGGGSDIISDIRQTVTETIQQETERVRTEDVTVTGEEEQRVIRRETRYYDIPTPEEFVDDFQNAIIGYADALHRAGDIDRATRDFMVTSPGYLWAGFVAEQNRRIEAGEPLYEVVGVTGPQIRLGSRPGEALQQEINITRKEVREGTLTIEDVVERTIDRLTEEAGTQGEGIVDTALRQAITEQVTSMFRELSTSTTRENLVETFTLLTVEEVIGRPKMEHVFAFSPTDYLRRYSPTELMNVAAAVPGREAAQARFPFGVAPSAPRRLQ